MKQTAVEWLVQALIISEDSPNYNQWAIEQAKAMEKEQIEEAYGHGQNNGYMYANKKAITIRKDQYYNETFKSE